MSVPLDLKTKQACVHGNQAKEGILTFKFMSFHDWKTNMNKYYDDENVFEV